MRMKSTLQINTDLCPYINTLKSLKLIETDHHRTFLEELKKVALEIYSTIYHIVDKKKQKESNFIEKITICVPK